ncbi:Small ubiquitin- modifier 1 [Lathyrus oleraceus]|uniref:Small ubiquitin- modifier 1 n=1 Tax=Pisum sativum TaxID=3888 RepID=A0A9D5AKP3_PEA|nr:Small ubiquitin- modifier 1 [Pisum sativum]
MSSGVANNEEDKKPTDQGGAHINLKVKGQDGNEVFFRIKRSTQLKKLMNAYCDRQSVDFNSIAFLFDGRRLRAEQTPDELEMEDGDEIDAMLHQTGAVVAELCKCNASFVNMIMSGIITFLPVKAILISLELVQ